MGTLNVLPVKILVKSVEYELPLHPRISMVWVTSLHNYFHPLSGTLQQRLAADVPSSV